MENKLTREEFMNKLIAYTKVLIPGYQGGAEWYDYDVKQQMWGTLYVDYYLFKEDVEEWNT